MKLFNLSLLAAVALAPAALYAEDPTTPGKLSTTTSVPQPNHGSGAIPSVETERVPGRGSTTTSVPEPARASTTEVTTGKTDPSTAKTPVTTK